MPEARDAQSGFQHYALGPGLNLYVKSTPQFKRTTVAAFVHRRLQPDTAAVTGLLPLVLQRGTQAYPTGLDLEKAMARLYGARLNASVSRLGDRQLVTFTLELPGDRFVGEPLLARGLEVLRQVMLEPVTEGDGLKGEYVAQEKELQIGRIRSLINDKISYARWRCIQHMFANDPYGIYHLGTEEGVRALTPQLLRQQHQTLLAESPIDLYALGDFDPRAAADTIAQVLAAELARRRQQLAEVPPTQVAQPQEGERQIVEDERMEQGWLVLGARTGIGYAHPDYYALQFYNGILGGFVHSKLFLNVREKASLAYAASSSVDPSKGVLLAMAGIDPQKYDQALAIMRQQLAQMLAGEISDEEMEATRKALTRQVKLVRDQPFSQIFWHLRGAVEGRARSLEEALAEIASIGRERVTTVARQVQLDTIYFLRGTGTGHRASTAAARG